MNLDLLRHVNNQQFDYISGSFAETLAASFLAVLLKVVKFLKCSLIPFQSVADLDMNDV